MKRLRIRQLLILSLWIGPLWWMLWMLRTFQIPEVEEALAHPDQTWLQNLSILSYFLAARWSSFLIPVVSAAVCLSAWGYTVARNRNSPITQHWLVQVTIWSSYVLVLATTLMVSVAGNLCMNSLEGHSAIYAGWAAHAGVLSGKPQSSNEYSLQRSHVVDSPAKLSNPRSTFAFYNQRISDTTTSSAVAKHLTGSLIVLLKAESEGTWSNAEPLELLDSTVEGIMRLSGRSFPLPSKPFEDVADDFSLVEQTGHSINADEDFAARSLQRLRSDADRKSVTVKELVEWWTTVADQPEWEALPFYEIDPHFN